jgi:hypothetical protein
MTDDPTKDLLPALDALQRAVAAADSWHQVSSDLRREATSPDDPVMIIASAFDYMLQTDRRGSQRQSPFEPMMRFESGDTVPPLVEQVDNDWLAVWTEIASAVDSPIARARLHDLLAERHAGDVRAHGLDASQAYREVARLPSWHPVERADCLIRALTLARRFNAPDVDEIRQEIVAAAQRSLEAVDPEPGVALSLISSLVSDPDCPEAVDRLLDVARSTYQGAHVEEDVIDLQKQRARGDAERIDALNRERVLAWLDEADRASGLPRVVHLETAARLARDAGLRDLEQVAQQHLQSVPKEDLELQHISAEASIPPEVVDEYLSPFTDAQSVDDLLVALVSHPPATGQVDSNRQAVERSRREFPLQHLLPRIVLGGDRLPRWSPSSDSDQEDGDLARQETLHFQLIGDLLARGLWLGGENLVPEPAAVEAFLERLPNHVDGVPHRLATAFAFYWQGDWTTAAFTALPCVEALSRSLVLQLGRGIYQTQRGQRPGQYPGLGVLLRWMRDEGLDESWYRYLWTILASPAGLNLRNEVAHGFAVELGPRHAAAILHMATYLAALHIEEHETSGAPPDPE